MKFLRWLIAAAVLAALGGFVWWSNSRRRPKPINLISAAAPKVLELKEADIKGIANPPKGGRNHRPGQGRFGQWSITGLETFWRRI